MPRASDRIGISATSGQVRRELRQVERQPGAHDDRVGAARARLPHVGGVFGDRAHHVDRDRGRCPRPGRCAARISRSSAVRLAASTVALSRVPARAPAGPDDAGAGRPRRSCRPRRVARRRRRVDARRCPRPCRPARSGSSAAAADHERRQVVGQRERVGGCCGRACVHGHPGRDPGGAGGRDSLRSTPEGVLDAGHGTGIARSRASARTRQFDRRSTLRAAWVSGGPDQFRAARRR